MVQACARMLALQICCCFTYYNAALLLHGVHRRTATMMLLPTRGLMLLCCRQPRWYGERMRRKIQAGAGVENLRLRCLYFYDVALLLHSMERGLPLAEFAMQTFQARYKAGPYCCVHIGAAVCWNVAGYVITLLLHGCADGCTVLELHGLAL